MNFREFVEFIKEYVEENLPRELENAQVRIFPVEKINESYVGMNLSGSGERIVPTVNMDALFRAYEENPRSLFRLAADAAYILCEEKLEVDIHKLSDYEYIKDRLFVKVCNLEKNAEVLKTVPYHQEAGLAVTYHIMVNERLDGFASVMIRNELLEVYGIDVEKLHEDAMKSAPRIAPVRVAPLEELMIENLREIGLPPEFIEQMETEIKENAQMDSYVVTTTGSITDASAIFYPGVMEELSERVGTDLIIFPSSKNECIVVSDDGMQDVEELKDLVRSINQENVPPEDRLADDVFHYDAKEKIFERFEDFSARQKEREDNQKESVLGKIKEKKELAMDYVPSQKAVNKDLGPVL